MITIEAKADKLRERREKLRSNVIGMIDSDLTLHAKRLAFYLMENTLPKSTASKPWPIEGLMDRILGDVMAVYPTVGDDNWINSAYMLIEDTKDKKAANLFYQKAVHLQGKEVSYDEESGGFLPRASPEEEFAKIRGIPRKIDDKGYSAMLKNKAIIKNGARQLPLNTRPMAMVRPGSADSYAEKRQKRAGLAKSAWWAAAKTLINKGQNLNASASKFEEGRFIWPSRCAQIARANPGIGSSNKSVSTTGGSVTLQNRLRYATEAMFPGGLDLACKRAKTAMVMLLQKRQKAMADNAARRAA